MLVEPAGSSQLSYLEDKSWSQRTRFQAPAPYLLCTSLQSKSCDHSKPPFGDVQIGDNDIVTVS
jgi:hypothetical protein